VSRFSNPEEDMPHELPPEPDTPPASPQEIKKFVTLAAKDPSVSRAAAAKGPEGAERQGGGWLFSKWLPSINFDIRWRSSK
jgi:hypothetical protein